MILFFLKIIFWFLVFGLIIALCVYGVLAWIYRDLHDDRQKITYRELLNIMPVNPNKWRLDDGAYVCAIYIDNGKETKLYMKSYFDCLRLQHLYNISKKKSLDLVLSKQKAELLKAWQKDINDYQEKYTNDIKKMRERI